MCFAGDALICVFRSAPGPKILIPQTILDDNVEDTDKNHCLRALQCATELKKRENEHLACHIAVTYGEINLAILGGHNDEWSYIINGPCLSELSSCIDDAGPKEVVCSRACYDKATGVTESQTGENNLNDNKRRTDLVNGLLCCSGSGNYLITSVTASKYQKGRKRPAKTNYQDHSTSSSSSSSSSSSASTSIHEIMTTHTHTHAYKDRSSDRLSSDFDGELEGEKFKKRKLEKDRIIEKDKDKDKMKNNDDDDETNNNKDRDDDRGRDRERDRDTDRGRNNQKNKDKGKDRNRNKESKIRRNDHSPDNNQSKDTLDISEHCPKVEFSSRVLEAAEYFVPRPALSAIYSSSLDTISELRQVTTMFLRLDTYSHVLHQDPVSLQPFFLLLQQVLDESGGFLRQFLIDDKVRYLDANSAFLRIKVPKYEYSCDCLFFFIFDTIQYYVLITFIYFLVFLSHLT